MATDGAATVAETARADATTAARKGERDGVGRPATKPPEARGLARDEVRLLVAGDGVLHHARFRDLPRFLRRGDLLVVNTSATLPAAIGARRMDGREAVVHFSTALDDGRWVIEVRPPSRATGPVEDAARNEELVLSGGAALRLVEPYPDASAASTRLWLASVPGAGVATGHREERSDEAISTPRNRDRFAALAMTPGEPSTTSSDVVAMLNRHGRPIAYAYVDGRWPLASYQTVFARHPGSAEMPSAGRPFSRRLVAQLLTAGVEIAPVLLHTGVSSLEHGEAPLPERFEVSAATAARIESANREGCRVIAVGTTAARAVETVAVADGTVHAGAGWTDLLLGPDRPARIVDGIVTGWHEPGSSHLRLLESIAAPETVRRAYREALAAGYLWHEFGDSALLMRSESRSR
ncbi:MAG TPA: S-adenosylmethionine:tRNA ribosyltransferase-isomerase [Thermoanaerobaculia bacterium]|nr:S-adenosylmethionine:tRNA ribosyltransferase-isomerase [Thermoanaerobaculia bacterium]